MDTNKLEIDMYHCIFLISKFEALSLDSGIRGTGYAARVPSLYNPNSKNQKSEIFELGHFKKIIV